jgi:hypothetical protein
MKAITLYPTLAIISTFLIHCGTKNTPTPSTPSSQNVGVLSVSGLAENFSVSLNTTSGYVIIGYGSTGTYNSLAASFANGQPNASATVTFPGTNPNIYIQDANGVDYEATAGTASILVTNTGSSNFSVTIGFANVTFLNPSTSNTISGSGQLEYVQ